MSRPGLIVTKVFKGRPHYLENLATIKPRQDEIDFVSVYLDRLDAKGTRPKRLDDARIFLSTLESHDED